jgi:hypothetical protein
MSGEQRSCVPFAYHQNRKDVRQLDQALKRARGMLQENVQARESFARDLR